MNKIYRVVWNKSTQTWTAVSEYATAQGKSSSRSAVAGSEKKSSKGVRFVYTALVSASLMMLGGQAWAADGNKYPIVGTPIGDSYCYYDNRSQSVVCGKEASVADTYDNKQAKSVAVGWKTKTTGESNVALGVNSAAAKTAATALGASAKALNDYGIAIGFESMANNTWDISIGRDAGGTVNSLGVDGTIPDGRNIAIGDGALKGGKQVNNNTVLGTSAGAGLTGSHNIAIGAHANDGVTVNATIDDKGVTKAGVAITADNTIAIGQRAAASTTSSIAIGNRSKASGSTAVAVGSSAMASSTNGVALGYNAQSKGSHAIAIGGGNVANAAQATQNFGIAIGTLSSSTGAQAIAHGYQASAAAANSIAHGNQASAAALNSIVIGSNASVKAVVATNGKVSDKKGNELEVRRVGETTGNGSVAIGMNSSAYGTNATAVGQASEALGQNSFAGGQDSHATGKSAVAVGDGAISSNDSTTSVGPYSKAIAAGSSAYGFQSNATGDHSTALGSGAQAIATQSTAVGRGSSAQGSNSLALGDRATVMQKGLEAYWQNGAYHTRDSLSVGAIAAGKEAVAKGDGAIAIGSGSQTEFANATGVGKLAKALGYNSSAFGFESMAKGKSSIAIGDKALAGSQDSNSHLPITNFGIAIGVNTNATGETAVALGSNAESKAHRGTALGVLSKAAVNDSVALGAYSIANRDKGEAGADPLSAKQVGADASVWTATHAAVSVGNDAAITDDPRQGATTKAGNFNIPKVTRQITGVAAGTQDTDAVNVAQLKAAGFVLATTADTQAGGVATTSANTSTDNKIVNGETLTLKAGKGVTLNQDGAEVTITTDLSKADKTHYFSVNHDNTLQGVGNNYNNDGATGRNALAAGSHAKATGEESTAIGHDSLAEGKQSVAVGYKAKAKGEHALAIGDVAEAAKWGTAVGYGSRAEGVGSPIAIGTNSQTIGGNSPMAIGDWATADGSGAIAIGSKIGGAHEADKSTFAQGDKAIALGYLTKATQRDAMALGAETSATAESTVAIGKKAQATDSNSISIGRQSGSAGIDLDNKGANNNADITSRTKAGKTNANGLVNVTSIGNEAGSGTINNNYGVNIGYQAGSGGYNSYYGEGVSIGNKAGGVDKTNATVKTAMEAFSAGQGATDNTIITGNTNTAISSRAGVNALGHDNVAIGKDAGGYSSGSSNIAIGRHAGRASKLNTPNNEATRVIDGDVFSNARNTISMGEWANASSDDATAVGRLASASGASSMALGHQATAKPEKSVAIGYNARAVGTETSSISIGENAYNNASGALVIGKDASAKGFADVLTTGASPAKALPYNAIAIGKGANVDTLVGTNGTQERSTDAIAIGTDAKANYASTIAIGYGAKANTKSSATAIGLNSDAQGWKSLAVGVGAVAKQTDSVALGSESVADIGFNQIGADPLNAQTDKNGHAWKSTKAAVSVGNVAGGVTRQITSVAAGTQDTDAVNVAQLRAAGFKLTISESDGVAVDSTEEKVKNGDTVTIDAGKNIKVTQTGSKVSIATKDNVTFNSVEVGNVYIDEANDDIIGLSNTFLGDDNFAADGRAATEEQLNETQDNLVRILGGNAKNNDGTVSTNNIGGTGKHTIDEAVQFVHDKTATTPLTIEGNKVAPLDPANTNKLVTAGDIANAINNTGFTLTTMTTNDGELGANSTNNQLIKAGDTVTVEADNNIKVTQANGKISVATKNDVKFDSVVAGGTKLDGNGLSFVNNDGTAVTNSPSISKTGINAGNQKITNVADGVIAADSKDAVNGGQLHAVKTTAESKLGAFTVGTDKNATAQGITIDKDKARFDIVGADDGKVITQVDGNKIAVDLTADAKDSLAKADSALQSIQVKANGTDVTTLGKDNNTLDITQGDNITVSNDGGKVKVALNQDVASLNSLTSKTITAGEGTNQVVLDNIGVNVGGKTYISDAGLNANSKKVTNVADGAITADSKDAVNGGQLHTVSTATKNLMGGNATVNTNGTVTASNIGGTNANTIDDAIKTVKTTVKSKDNSIKVTANPADTTNGTVFDISVNAQGLAESAQLPVVYTKADGTKVYKVGSKFFDNKEGTGTEIEATNIIASMQNADGTITPTTLANIKAGTKDTDAVNVSQLKGVADTLGGGASINADGTINAPTYNITNPADGGVIKAQNVGDALNALNTAVNNPLTFAGDTGLFNRNLGQTTTIKGGVIDENKLSNSNIGVVAKDGTLDIKLAKDITIDSVTTGNTTVNNEGVTIKAPAGNNTVTDVKLTANGLNNGGNKITNVADGEVVAGSKDAVNGGQLFNIKQDIVTNATNVAKGLSFAGNTGEFNSQLGDKVTVSGGLNDASITSSNTNIRTVAKDGKIDIQLADAPVFTGKVSAKGLDAGNQKITGVLAGDDKTDAVNVEQLSKALANVTVANQSLVQANSPFSYINKAGEQLVRKVAVVNGKSVVTFEKAKDGSIYTGDDITITALNPTDPQTAIPTLISNVKAGINDNDAVNVSQLKKVDAKAIVKTKVVQGDGITVTNKGSAEAPNYEVSLDKDIKDSLTGANNSLQTIKVKANGKNVKELTKDNNELNIKGDSNITVTNDNGEVKVGLADVITVGSPNNATGATNNPIKIDGEKGAITGLTNKDLTATDFAKAGRAATEEQLKAVNDFAVKYDTDPTSGNPNKDSVTFAGTPATPAIKAVDDKFTMAGGTVLNNVASAGDYTQAVNAYKATNAGDLNNAVIDVTNKGLKFAGNVGNEFTAKLGTTVGIKGGMVESTPTSATSGDNVITRTDNYGNINIELAKNAKFDSVITGSTKIDNNGLTFVDNAGKPVANSPSISQTGINAGNQRITGILAGDDKTDAVNVEQLNKALANITVTNQSIVQANSPFSYVNTAGEQLIREVKTVNGKKEVAFKKAKDGTAYTGDDITIAALNPADPQTTLPTTIGNIKAGVQANDAVNVSQLKGMVTALGGGASIQDDGSLKAPEYTIHKTDGQAVKVNNVGDAVQALNNEVTKPFTFIGDNGEKVARKLGENITVKGGATGNLTKNNIGIVANSATGELNVQLAETVNLGQNGSVAMGNTLVNNAGITVGDKVALTNTGLTTGDITVNADGINAGNKAISNVANGVNANDAVNVSQLKAVQDSMKTASVTAGSDAITVSKTTNGNNTDYTIDLANSTKADIAKGVDAKNAVDTKGLTFTADAGKTTAKKLGDSIAITGDKNISTNATADGVKVSLNENIAVKEVKADISTIGSVTINNAGINMGEKQITGLASGLNGKTLEDIKADLTTPERNNAATVGDLATVQNNVTNITNNILQNTIGDEHFVELGGKLTEEGKLALKTYDVSGQEGTTNNTIISAIKNINEGGIKYFHTNDGTNKPGGTKDLNSEDSSASGAYATAIGYQADAQGNLSIAFGKGAKALAERTISIGTGNIVSGEGSGAIGDPSIINGANSYSVGNNNTVATDSTFVLGNNVTQTLANSVILGDGSAATEVHTIAKGGNYTYAGANDANVAGVNNVVGVVSVGTQGDAQKPSETRQIQNVAAGVVSANSTDAINGSQLYDTHQAIGNINHRIGDIEDKANAGVSSAMAMASLPQAYIPGKSMLTGGVATYNGEGAVAVGLSKLSDNGRWVLKMSGSADTKGNAGASIGAGFHF